MALKQCKECGEQVSTKAMSCPHCGAVLKRKTGCFTWLVAIFFILFMFGTFASKYSYKTPESANKSALKNIMDNYDKSNLTTDVNPIDKIKPEEVYLANLLDQYRNNEVRADELYKDKIIQTTGIVEMVNKDIINDIYVILRTERGLEIPMVQCYFDKQLVSQVSQINMGDSITIKGHLRGLMVNVLVDKCSIVQPSSDNYDHGKYQSKKSKYNSTSDKLNSNLMKPSPFFKTVKLIEVPNSDNLVKIILEYDKISREYAKDIKVAKFDVNNDGKDDILYTYGGGSCGYGLSILINKGNGKYEKSKCEIGCTGLTIDFSNKTFKGLRIPYFMGEKQVYTCMD